MAASLHNIFIFVTDIPRAKGLYVDQLGLPLAGENEMMLEFFPGSTTTMSVALALQDDAAGMVGRHTGITLKMEGLEALCKKVAAAGTAFVMPFEATPWGKMAVIADPDGNQIRLWER